MNECESGRGDYDAMQIKPVFQAIAGSFVRCVGFAAHYEKQPEVMVNLEKRMCPLCTEGRLGGCSIGRTGLLPSATRVGSRINLQNSVRDRLDFVGAPFGEAITPLRDRGPADAKCFGHEGR